MKSSINTDLFFFAALQNSSAVRELVDKRIFHTFRDSTAESQDKIPYIIVTADEVSSTASTKDDIIAPLDTAVCSVLCVAKDPYQLAELTTSVLHAVEAAFSTRIWEDHEDWDFEIEGISPYASGIEADPDRPCLFRWLHFRCEI